MVSVLVPGSRNEIFDPLASTDVAPVAPRRDRTFVPTGRALYDRTGHVAMRLADGRVLLVGGRESRDGAFEDNRGGPSADVFDPSAGSFKWIGPFASGGQPQVSSTVQLPDGRVLALAQQHVHRQGPIWEIYSFDPATGHVSFDGQIASEAEVERSVRMVELSDARVLVLGAPLTPQAIPNEDMVVYRLDRSPEPSTIVHSADSLTKIGDLPGCGNITDVVVGAGDRVAVACLAPDAAISSLFLFDPSTGATTRLDAPLGVGPAVLARLADGRVLAAAGSGTTSLLIVDVSTGASTMVGSTVIAARDPSASPTAPGMTLTLLADGRVLILSGIDASVFDPATNDVRQVPGPTALRMGQTATLLDDGRVLVFGGTTWPADTGVPTPPSAEIFDPAAIP